MDRANQQQQNQMNQARGQYEAQKASADIAGNSAWVKGLDSLVSRAIPAAQAVHGMGMENKKFAETQKTGEANRANLMEATLGQRQKNELDAQFGQRERSAGIGMTEAQTKGIGITNEQGQIALQKAQREEQFANTDAAQAGFEKAARGETIAQYTMRMKASGDIAEVQRVIAESRKAGLEADFMPKRLALEEKKTNADIAYQRGSLGIQAQDLALRRQQDQRQAEAQNFDMRQKREEKAAAEFSQFITGLESGTIGRGQGQPKLTQGEIEQLVTNELKNKVQAFGGNPQDEAAFLSRVKTMNASNATASKAAQNVLNQSSPETKIILDQNMKQQQKLTTANELVANLKNSVVGFGKGAGAIYNSDSAKMEANKIQMALDNAARQVPEFIPYAEEFKRINAKISDNPLEAIKNMSPFTPTVKAQTEALLQNLIDYIQTDVKAGGPIHPTMMQNISTLTSNFNMNASSLGDLMKAANIQKLQPPIQNPNIPQQTNYGVGGRR